jgi:hypothetical protein
VLRAQEAADVIGAIRWAVSIHGCVPPTSGGVDPTIGPIAWPVLFASR